jgi:uncharacterized protein (TIGR03546 family)
MLNLLLKLLTALNSETDPTQISLGFCFGLILGFTPFLSMHNLVVLFLLLSLRVNISACMLAWGFFAGVAYALDQLFLMTGEFLLALPSMQEQWTAMYNSDFWRLTHFNNTMTLGSLAISLMAFIPMFFIFRISIIRYRKHLLARVRNSRFMQILQTNKLYQAYSKFNEYKNSLS